MSAPATPLAPPARLPGLLYLFALCNLVLGSGAFGLGGILEQVATDLKQPVQAVGQNMTAYAFATALLAPVLLVLPADHPLCASERITLEDLAESHARHGGLAGMLAAERERAAPPVMPRIEVRTGEVRVVMPWDPGYGEVSGEGCQPTRGFPPHLLRRRSCLAVARDREAR